LAHELLFLGQFREPPGLKRRYSLGLLQLALRHRPRRVEGCYGWVGSDLA
jgi:hypothetical protein